MQTHKKFQDLLQGSVGYLCHTASVNRQLDHGIEILQELLGPRLKKLFGPQHGLITDVQDNMIESQDFIHPYYQLPVHSLYSHTRIPTDEMLEGIDTMVIDLQDVGCRVYTYIYTMTLMMQVCGKKGIRVIVLDRPNPLNGETVEGNVLEEGFRSFVGLHPLPMRHALTIGEVAQKAKAEWGMSCELTVVPMDGWERWMDFADTGLPWVLPSPNLPTLDSCYCFPATVLFEGTNLSEGRGSTRSLEILGHPQLQPHKFIKRLQPLIQKEKLQGFVLRPLYFQPTFQKHAGVTCGGFQIHLTDKKTFRPWSLGQFLMRELYHELGEHFQWKQPPYEYEYERMPIDLINGSDFFRLELV